MFGSKLDTDHGLVLDLLDSLGELQGLERFLKMGVFSAGGTKQGCLGVASKTLFQQLCERGFSEWNIAIPPQFTVNRSFALYVCRR